MSTADTMDILMVLLLLGLIQGVALIGWLRPTDRGTRGRRAL